MTPRRHITPDAAFTLGQLWAATQRSINEYHIHPITSTGSCEQCERPSIAWICAQCRRSER